MKVDRMTRILKAVTNALAVFGAACESANAVRNSRKPSATALKTLGISEDSFRAIRLA